MDASEIEKSKELIAAEIVISGKSNFLETFLLRSDCPACTVKPGYKEFYYIYMVVGSKQE
jgi:hypothetical protein